MSGTTTSTTSSSFGLATAPEMTLCHNPSVKNDSDTTITNPEAVGTSTRQEQQQQEEQRSLPLVSFVEGFRNKPSFGLQAWNHLILTLDGRDKFTKLLQYTCRLLAWWLQQSIITNAAATNNNNKSDRIGKRLSAFFITERFAAMKNSLATSRKAFRLGRSMVEIQKIQSLGIVQWLDEYRRRSSSGSNSENDPTVTTNYFIRAFSDVAYSMCHPLAMNLTSKPQTQIIQTPFWNVAGNSIKSLGLLIFWAADNMSFLLQSGFLDDYQQNSSNRLNKRTHQIVRATNLANRSYFIAAVAGLVTNWISYWDYTTKHVKNFQKVVVTLESKGTTQAEAEKALQKGLEKQFTLFVSLMKSICDVLVFSNNAGVDLWRRYHGRPLHEGLHCLCGIVSASVVLYNNYPNMSDME